MAERTAELESASAALRESEERLQTLVANAPVLLYAIDREGVITYSEGQGLTALSVDHGKVIGTSAFDAYRRWPDAIANLTRSLAGEATSGILKMGDLVLDVHNRPVFDDDGEVTGVIGVALDVSQRRRAEERLRESEERYRDYYQNAPNAYLSVDIETGVIIEHNQTAAEMLGRSGDEIIGHKTIEFYASNAHQEAHAAMQRFCSEGSIHGVELQVVRKDGTVIDVSLDATAVRDEDGNIVRSRSVWRDITARKRAEERLRAEEVRYRELFENANDIIYTHDMQGSFTSINRVAEQVTGYTRDEIIGESVAKVIAPEFLELAREKTLSKLKGEPSTVWELELVTKDGSRVPVEVRTTLISEHGEPVGVQGIARDITERKRAEAALRGSEERFRWLIESAPDAMVVTNGKGLIMMINTETERLFGYEKDELLGRSVELLVPGRFHEVHVGNREGYVHSRSMRRMGVDRSELWGLRKDGSEFPIEIGLSPLETEDGLLITAAVRDITDRKEAEKEIAILAKFPDENPDPVLRISADGQIEYANRCSEPLLNAWNCEVGQRLPDEWCQLISRATASNEAEEVELASGEQIFAVTFSPVVEAGYVNVFGRDITVRKRAEDSLRDKGTRDSLTGLLNHAAVVEELSELMSAASEGATIGVAMVDIDGMKALNDTYGHQLGDEALVLVANALSRGGALVGRYGGDEFVVVLPGAGRNEAEGYSEAVMAKLEDARLVESATGSKLRVAASIGLAVYPNDGDNPHDLIRLADSAMYASRRQRYGETGGGRRMSDREAKMVGQIVPLLTRPGDLDEKLRLVAQRLVDGADCDAVNIVLFPANRWQEKAARTAAGVAQELLRELDSEQRAELLDPVALKKLLERVRRPIMMDDLQGDERLTPAYRALMAKAGLRSGLVVPMLWQDSALGSLSVASKRAGAFTARDAEFFTAVAVQVTAIVRMETLVEELQTSSVRLAEAHSETVMLLAAAAEAHDRTTGLHLQGIRTLTEALARELGYSDEGAVELGLASVLHDIGKIRVPGEILARPGRLSPEEWELMQRHTVWGVEFLSGRSDFGLASTIARCHHEQWDGSGYPDGLVGEEIPEPATIVSVADSFDAMTHDRPYKAGRSIDQALAEIVDCSGSQFSPRVVDALVRVNEAGLLERARFTEKAA